jgi:3-oxoacyl-ACP reductase-like protein
MKAVIEEAAAQGVDATNANDVMEMALTHRAYALAAHCRMVMQHEQRMQAFQVQREANAAEEMRAAARNMAAAAAATAAAAAAAAAAPGLRPAQMGANQVEDAVDEAGDRLEILALPLLREEQRDRDGLLDRAREILEQLEQRRQQLLAQRAEDGQRERNQQEEDRR